MRLARVTASFACGVALGAVGTMTLKSASEYRIGFALRNRGKLVKANGFGCAQRWNRTRLVWLVAYAKMADRRDTPPFACGPENAWHRQAYREIVDGEIVFVRTGSIRRWVREVLPTIRPATRRFALVTSDGPRTDYQVPDEVLNTSEADALLGHPSLVCWYSTNALDRRVRPLPLGLDLHTRARTGRLLWPQLSTLWRRSRDALVRRQRTPAEQEAELLELVRTLPPTASRRVCAWADFQFERSNQKRQRLWRQLRGRTFVVAPSSLMASRVELWRTKSHACMFDLSPPGHGFDTHRTWESLALGMIPIVLSSPMDDLYEGLPVVLVRSYADVTEERLREWAAEAAREASESMGSMRGAVSLRLTLSYWESKIRAELSGSTEARVSARATTARVSLPAASAPASLMRSSRHGRRRNVRGRGHETERGRLTFLPAAAKGPHAVSQGSRSRGHGEWREWLHD